MPRYNTNATSHPATQELGDLLTRRWLDFGRLLRRNGVLTTPAQMRDLLRVLPLLDLRERETVHFAARAMLCARHDDLPRFDLAFRQFWGRTRQIIIPSDTGSLEEPSAPAVRRSGVAEGDSEEQSSLPVMKRMTVVDSEESVSEGGANEHGEKELEQALLYSAQERLRRLDFMRFTDEELARAKAMLSAWEWSPGLRRTRRVAPSHQGRRLDFPRTLRRAMGTGGVPFSLAMLGPRRKPRPLVLLCDVSGSMAPYTRLLLHFLHTLYRRVARVEVFLFGTRLTRITRELRARDVDHALEEVSATMPDWAGGTRTGDALRQFNTRWARRVLGRGAIVVIISDGWDRGDPAILAAEMSHLQRMSFRLVWLNPLLGLPGYRPLTRGMVAALPFIDDFLPANNLAGLETLANLLTSVAVDVRPSRRQILRMATA